MASDTGLPTRELTGAERKLLKRCQAAVQDIADQMNISARLIANKQMLSIQIVDKADGNDKTHSFSGWRQSVVGDSLESIIVGGSNQ